jgi:hypothetical protein
MPRMMCTSIHVYIHTHTDIYIHTHTLICGMYVRMHVCMQAVDGNDPRVAHELVSTAMKQATDVSTVQGTCMYSADVCV